MHSIHHTNAFVLKSIESGEASKRVWLYTREFGLIIAVVQGVRKPGAKLASHITDYTYITADILKGREVWRLVSAQVVHNPFVLDYDKLRARSYIRALSLVQRFCIEEGPEEELFVHMIEVMQTLSIFSTSSSSTGSFFDTVVLWKILIILGYLEIAIDLESLYNTPLLHLPELQEQPRKDMIKAVTDAISRTQL